MSDPPAYAAGSVVKITSADRTRVNPNMSDGEKRARMTAAKWDTQVQLLSTVIAMTAMMSIDGAPGIMRATLAAKEFAETQVAEWLDVADNEKELASKRATRY